MLDDLRAARWIRPRVAEAAPQDARERQAQLPGEIPDFVLPIVDQVAAGFTVLTFSERLADGQHAPADAVPGIDDGDLCAAEEEIAGGGETGEPRADDEHLNASEIAGHICSTR